MKPTVFYIDCPVRLADPLALRATSSPDKGKSENHDEVLTVDGGSGGLVFVARPTDAMGELDKVPTSKRRREVAIGWGFQAQTVTQKAEDGKTEVLSRNPYERATQQAKHRVDELPLAINWFGVWHHRGDIWLADSERGLRLENPLLIGAAAEEADDRDPKKGMTYLDQPYDDGLGKFQEFGILAGLSTWSVALESSAGITFKARGLPPKNATPGEGLFRKAFTFRVGAAGVPYWSDVNSGEQEGGEHVAGAAHQLGFGPDLDRWRTEAEGDTVFEKMRPTMSVGGRWQISGVADFGAGGLGLYPLESRPKWYLEGLQAGQMIDGEQVAAATMIAKELAKGSIALLASPKESAGKINDEPAWHAADRLLLENLNGTNAIVARLDSPESGSTTYYASPPLTALKQEGGQ